MSDQRAVQVRMEEFRGLQEMAVRLHPYSWCVKVQLAVPTGHLSPRECVTCPHYILNGGICDPL
jgi:hypothetical protein